MSFKPSSAGTRSTFLALSCIAPVLSPAAHAQVAEAGTPSLGGVTVTDTAISEAPGRRLESPKRTRTVLDTPQTITVLTADVIEKQNLLTLQDVLATVPGITFGAGEGGGGYGDKITFRGYSANTDITVDGVRDSGIYTRSDPFNLEQIEITNGANSVVSGAGSTGGSINLVTKRPATEDAVAVTGGVGTAEYYRATADMNKRVNDLIAVRLNAMWHRNDVPGRDVEQYERWGVAPSVTIGVENPTSLTLQYFHQEDDNIPLYGVPYYVSDTVSGAVPGVDPSDYFGYRNADSQTTNVDQFTAIFEHEISDTVSLRNLARWQDVRQTTLVNPPQGTYCLTSGLTPAGAACDFAGYYQPSGPRGTTRNTRNQLAFDQIDLKAVLDTGGIEHTIDLGGAASWEKYNLFSGNSQRNADGSAAYSSYPLINIANPNNVVTGPDAALVYGSNVYTGPLNYIETRRDIGEQTNVAAYLFDTMKLGKLELSTGLRIDRTSGTYRRDAVSTDAETFGIVTPGERVKNSATMFTYRVGLVYKPVETLSLYIAYGNSQTPSKASVNGSCDIDTSCNIDPEEARNYEIGAKAELFGGGLMLSASAFRNERNKYAVDSGDPTIADQQLDGKSRVDGIALSAIGQITPDWSVTANYTYLDATILRSIAANSPAGTDDPLAGTPLANTPEHSGSVFTTYTLPFGLSIGYGATYQGSYYLSSRNAPAVAKVDDYWVHNAYLAYQITPNIAAQINIKNMFDTAYYTRVRNNGWATPGEARSAVLTFNVRM